MLACRPSPGMPSCGDEATQRMMVNAIRGCETGVADRHISRMGVQWHGTVSLP